jgi:hypothetical protein
MQLGKAIKNTINVAKFSLKIKGSLATKQKSLKSVFSKQVSMGTQGSSLHLSGFCKKLCNKYKNILKYGEKFQISHEIPR